MANIKDFAVSTVVTAPSPATTGTSLVVTTGEGSYFPAAPFFATLAPTGFLTNIASSEKVLVTDKSGDTFTIVRAQSPTTAKTVATGWIISNSLYADDVIGSSIVQNETLSGTPNGSTTAFTTASSFTYIALYKNGVRMNPGASNDYTVTGTNQVTFNTPPATGSVLIADYITGAQTMINGSNSVIEETPTGTANGANTSFSATRPYVGGSLEVYINGVKQATSIHFTESTPSTGAFTMSDAPITTDNIIIRYQYSTGVTGNADTVDGVHANTTATANMLYPLDSNAKIKANMLSNPYKFSAFLSANQTVTANTWTKVNLDTEWFDTNNNFNNTTTYQYTAPVDGFYMLIGSGYPAASGTNTVQVGINVGTFSSTPTYVAGQQPSGGITQSFGVTAFAALLAGQTVQLYAYSPTTTIYNGSGRTYLMGYLVSAI